MMHKKINWKSGLIIFFGIVFLGTAIHFYLAKKSEQQREDDEKHYLSQEVILPSYADLKKISEIGKRNAPVTLYIACSFLSNHCADFYRNIFPAIKKEYVEEGKLKIKFYDIGVEHNTILAAMLGRCLNNKETYVKLIQSLYKNQQQWYNSQNIIETLIGYGKISGLNYASAKACLLDQELYETIVNQSFEIQDEYNINSTPFFIIQKGKKTRKIRNYGELENALKKF